MTEVLEIHRRLAEKRLNEGKSIRALAKDLDVHQHTIRALERGESVSPASAKKVADWLGCTVVDLLGLPADETTTNGAGASS